MELLCPPKQAPTPGPLACPLCKRNGILFSFPFLFPLLSFSRILEDEGASQTSSMAVMNPRWLAPEVMQGLHATPAAGGQWPQVTAPV